MTEENRCPQCGADLPADAPHGLCPKCLMKMGLESDAKATIDDPGDIESPGTRIGRYKLLQLIGEGGMGLVYLAEQQEPVRRRVALKVVKPGMDSKQVIARFEAERQALALLDHPNIARVFDAGTTETGRPYFVMEYVKGLSLIEHCDREKLSIKERLELFLQVCEAIQHAHQKGIIHRDIKPSNVLVSKEDEKALPKIIDFGVAKALTQPLTERTLFTVQGQLIGTPEYMSPEQVDMAIQDIDIRSDIYSLGVLLYELLAGALPFERKEMEQAGLAEIQRIIREEDPPRPSTRLSSLGKEAESIAESRRTKVAMLAKRLHKELEWIPLKAMRKERARRYRTASELADDVQNYLNGAPLIAGPESAVYRVRKFVRRNRALVTGIAAVLVVLAAGVVVSTIFAIGQARARDEAVAARDEAERQAKVSRAVVDFLNNDVLGRAKGKQTVGDLLDATSENIKGKFEGEGLVEASIRKALGLTYRSLGKYEAAQPHLERALEIRREQLGEDHWDTLASMVHLASVYLYRGQKDKGKSLKGESLFDKALKLGERKWKDDMRKWVDDMRDIRDEYTWWKIIVSVIRSTLYGEEDTGFEEGMRLGFEKFMVAINKFGNLLADAYTGFGEYEKAEEQLLKVVDNCLDLFGEEHPSTVESINKLIEHYEAWGKPEKAKEWRAKLLGKKDTEE